MGIRNFSKTFKHTRIVKYANMQGQIVGIDAFGEAYRAALGAKSVSALTDSHGNPTMHINVILSIVSELNRSGVKQIWFFDYDQNPNESFHNPAKLGELAKRRKRKEVAIEKIKSIADLVDDEPMFSEDEEEPTVNKILDEPEASPDPPVMPELTFSEEELAELAKMSFRQQQVYKLKKRTDLKHQYEQALADYEFAKNKKDKLQSLEKQTFSVSKEMINDIKYILSCLNIEYVDAPKGFEGEAIAAYFNELGRIDAVLSGDTDSVAYGAKILYRRNPRDKLIYEYTIEDILEQITTANENIPKPTMNDLLTVALALGTDTCEKTPGIGPGTVLKKLDTIRLTKTQKSAMNEFLKRPTSDIPVHNQGKTPFVDDREDELVDWLVKVKSFNKTRVLSVLEKAKSVKTTKVGKSKAKSKKSEEKETQDDEEDKNDNEDEDSDSSKPTSKSAKSTSKSATKLVKPTSKTTSKAAPEKTFKPPIKRGVPQK